MSLIRIVAEGLACRRGGRLLFSGLDFSLTEGGALAVTGRNGAGKSSLLAMLCGRLRPAAGHLRIEGAGDVPLPEMVNAVGHREGLKAMLTAEENLAFAQSVLQQPYLKPQDALERFEVGHLARMPVAYLSAGQRRRVALARLFVTSRPIWILDEPTAALDSLSQQLLADAMRAHRANNGLIIAATHGPLGLDGTDEVTIAPAPSDVSTSDPDASDLNESSLVDGDAW